jgi:hypothetical protein
MPVARTFSLFFFNGGRNSWRINRTCSAFCFSSRKTAGEISMPDRLKFGGSGCVNGCCIKRCKRSVAKIIHIKVGL